jgi:hypothetical protein
VIFGPDQEMVRRIRAIDEFGGGTRRETVQAVRQPAMYCLVQGERGPAQIPDNPTEDLGHRRSVSRNDLKVLSIQEMSFVGLEVRTCRAHAGASSD